MKRALLLSLFFAGCQASSTLGQDEADLAEMVTRPPQFVMLAFDGSLNLSFWEESRAFARDSAKAGTPLKFTYFISGPYYLQNTAKDIYKAPKHKAGASDIGFGGVAGDISQRFAQTNAAFQEGHEIGSHANGHYDGTSWSEADWNSELDQFNSLIFDAATTNAMPQLGIGFPMEGVLGFRAPLLAQNAALYPALVKHGFGYDTSKIASTTYWPELQGGIWNFPLAQLKIVGSGKKTLSMDYNFYLADSKGVKDPDSSKYAVYEKQMFDTYMQYFDGNYNGNRAPVHIGHHFSKWNGSAYWNAMRRFAKAVCGKPEVQCVTYTELMQFMNDNASKRPSYVAGRFPKTGSPVPPPDAISQADDPTDEGWNALAAAHDDDFNDDAASGSAVAR